MEYPFNHKRGLQTYFKGPAPVAGIAAPGRGRRTGFALYSIGLRQPDERPGRLGRFEIVSVDAYQETVGRKTSRLATHPGVAETVPVYHTSADTVRFVPEGTITLRFRAGTPPEEAGAASSALGLSGVGVTRDGAHVMAVARGPQDAAKGAAALVGLSSDLAEADQGGV